MDFKFKGIIFDLDGTLANTMLDLQSGMNDMLRIKGLPERSLEELIKGINRGAREFVRASLTDDRKNDEEFLDGCYKLYSECYARHCNEQTSLYDTVAEGIALLKKMGIKLAVLSNKQDSFTKAIIEKLFPENTFDMVLGHIDGRFPHKPKPDSTQHIVDKLGLKAEEMLFVGDSNVDMETAQNSGIYPVGVSWGYRPADFLLENGALKIIDDMSELCEFIKEF